MLLPCIIERIRIFFDSIKIGEKLRVFGAIHTFGDSVEVLAEKMAFSGATNYRRWWNNSWSVVEKDRFNSPWTIEQAAAFPCQSCS